MASSTKASRAGGRGDFPPDFSPSPWQRIRISSKRPKPRLTHFISLPLGHHVSLRERISTFTTALQYTQPPMAGLDESIIIAPRRLHLTLGVMSLDSIASQTSLSTAGSSASPVASESRPKTLPSALSLLTDLRPRILDILGNQTLRVPLNRMDIMKPDHGDLEKAHVLWVGPLMEDEDGMRLKNVCMLVNRAFLDAGLVIDEHRPLKLHCTIINTVYRKPRSTRRQPFSYTSVVTSAALQAIRKGDSIPSMHQRKSVPVDLGIWDVNEIQICEMGSYGPQGEYVTCGGCSW